ncbi:hypothetical protein [Streptomyces sp. NPDC091046]|uniref:hypothetical protein n=2 Tax=unclassified Streptomyces TaxID=2593676 RepID=UPI00381716E2
MVERWEMDERCLVDVLMKAVGEEAREFVVRPLTPGLRKFAAFAYVAEQFGYSYAGHAPGNAALNNPYFVFQHTSGWREAPGSSERFGPTAVSGSLPGMRPGLGLTPTEAARPRVELLYSRMVVDASGRYNPRVLSNVLLLPLVMAVFLFFPGYTRGRVLLAAGIWAVFLCLYLVGLAVSRLRRARHLARLSAALGE